jgi:hypothetical protein
MNAWSWVPTGLIAWSGASLAVGVWLGPILRRCSQAREAMDTPTTLRMGHVPPGGF